MPHIAISMYPGRDQEVKKKLALSVQEFVSKELNLDKSVVSVSVEDVPKEQWADHMKEIPEETIFTDYMSADGRNTWAST